MLFNCCSLLLKTTSLAYLISAQALSASGEPAACALAFS
jgi:hypothetical protein